MRLFRSLLLLQHARTHRQKSILGPALTSSRTVTRDSDIYCRTATTGFLRRDFCISNYPETLILPLSD